MHQVSLYNASSESKSCFSVMEGFLAVYTFFLYIIPLVKFTYMISTWYELGNDVTIFLRNLSCLRNVVLAEILSYLYWKELS